MNLVSLLLNNIPRFWLMKMARIFQPLFTIILRGKKFYCPVCNKSYSYFFPYGYKNVRKNALCPGCFSLERHRYIWLFLKEKTNLFKVKTKLLHIAPEPCFYYYFKKLENIEYITVDLESPYATIKADIQNLPFEDEKFDFLICNHVLEHVENDKKAIIEMNRVLRKNGFAIITVPIDTNLDKTFEDPDITTPADRLKYYNQKDHYRVYGKDFYKIIEKYGFYVYDNNFVNELKENDKKRYAIADVDYIYLLRKK